MEQVLAFIRCEETGAKLCRPDPLGRGIFAYCKEHRREELRTWQELGLTKEIAELFLLKIKEPVSHE